MNWNQNITFDKVVCINLSRRPEKWSQFLRDIPENFPFGKIERFEAIDGKQIENTPAHWFKGGRGAWGCYKSHKRIIEKALEDRLKSILILEDDALFLDNFSSRAIAYMQALPDNAEMIYFGGQHLKRGVKAPEKINELVYRPYNLNRTHAYGIIGRDAMLKVLQHLNRRDWNTPHHIDHWYGRLHESGTINVYCPDKWLVDQRGGESDVACRTKKSVHWKDAVTVPNLDGIPYYAILGCHSSGSSALAGAMYHLGVHLGNKLVGLYGSEPIKGGEAIGLRNIYERAFPVPMIESQVPEQKLINKLRKFITQKRTEAVDKGTVTAGKYPMMALTYDILRDIIGDDLRVIWIDRNIEESILSLQKRFRNIEPELIANHQRAIYANSQRAFEESRDKAIRVTYDDLLQNPEKEIKRVADFMNLSPSPSQLEMATLYINGKKRHINLNQN